MRKVFIANFGRGNYEWPVCLERNAIATMNGVAAQAYWASGDRESYIQLCMKGRTAAGISPTRPVASRWFNLMSIIAQSSEDIWIHREKDQLWWTTSRAEPPWFESKVEPIGDKLDVVVCYKSCDPWSDKNRKGNRLNWNGLHPKAREFLFTEGTLQRLSDDNAEYALALIDGVDLSTWHQRGAWKSKEERARGKRGIATIYSAKQRAAARMAMTAAGTVAASNGQRALRTVKNKELKFISQQDFEKYLIDLIEMQDGLCMLTGIPLQYDGECEDSELLCSLDRIDSNLHYEVGNLQVVCRFANRWKNDDSNEEFKRLVGIVRANGSA